MDGDLLLEDSATAESNFGRLNEYGTSESVTATNHDHFANGIMLDEDGGDKLVKVEQVPGSSQETIVTCHTCGSSFSNQEELGKHHKLQHGDVFECGQCSQAFSNTNELERHVDEHLGLYKCPHCVASFLFSVELDEHLKSHPDKRPYVCSTDNCGKNFIRKYHLQRHLRLHSKITIACPHCVKKFRVKEYLHDHVRSQHAHSRLQATCQKCQCTYTHTPTVTIDSLLELAKKSYICPLCRDGLVKVPTTSITASSKGSQTTGSKQPVSKRTASATPIPVVTSHPHRTRSQVKQELLWSQEKQAKSQELADKVELVFDEKTNVTQIRVVGVGGVVDQEKGSDCADTKASPRSDNTGLDNSQDMDKEHSSLKNYEISDDMEEVLQVCPLCEQKFTAEKELSDHLLSHVQDASQLESLSNVVETNADIHINCSHCKKKFATLAKLKNHLFKKHKHEEGNVDESLFNGSKSQTEPCTCPHCGKAFPKKSYLARHVMTHDQQKPFKCTKCPKSFARNQRLQDHLQQHAGIKPYICQHCGKGFLQKVTLQRHIKGHTREEIFNCSECGKEFACKEYYDMHLKRHQQLKPCLCSLCGKGFENNGKLRNHMMTHSGERPFSCPHPNCGKTFKRSDHLKSHRESHENLKTFQCPQCPMKFVSKNYLRNHVRTHVAVKPYECPHCGKRLSSNHRLKDHLLIHTGEKPFPCAICGKKFRREDHLNYHVKTHKKDGKAIVLDEAIDLLQHQSLPVQSYPVEQKVVNGWDDSYQFLATVIHEYDSQVI